MRGEDADPRYPFPVILGSPPHARGRQALVTTTDLFVGITPACAGKTQAPSDAHRFDADHPRMRGEDFSYSPIQKDHQGSPPHARGRHPGMRDAHFNKRITPACAGKTPGCPIVSINSTDHPRMRGEDETHGLNIHPTRGSPPHARGRLSDKFEFEELGRITPACAGKTVTPVSSGDDGTWITPACAGKTLAFARKPPRMEDHPRMRGEDCPVGVIVITRIRITPACAGKTQNFILILCTARDHPRMRGEDAPLWRPTSFGTGSPPHARGRRISVALPPGLFGITPACAGKTGCGSAITGLLTDHPRMRGEDNTVGRPRSSASGSPPHARGRPR